MKKSQLRTSTYPSPAFLTSGPENGWLTLVLAHGAGAAMDSPFMNTIAGGVAREGVRVVRFEFPYMRARRECGKKRPPDREPVLLQACRDVIQKLGGGDGLVIGGKSLGGRIASMVADQAGVRGLVCLGYPFHPPGNPARLRTDHLKAMETPTLIIQGARDPFGPREEVTKYKLSSKIRIEWIADGDHSLKPRARSGRSETGNLSETISLISDFLVKLAQL